MNVFLCGGVWECVLHQQNNIIKRLLYYNILNCNIELIMSTYLNRTICKNNNYSADVKHTVPSPPPHTRTHILTELIDLVVFYYFTIVHTQIVTMINSTVETLTQVVLYLTDPHFIDRRSILIYSFSVDRCRHNVYIMCRRYENIYCHHQDLCTWKCTRMKFFTTAVLWYLCWSL